MITEHPSPMVTVTTELTSYCSWIHSKFNTSVPTWVDNSLQIYTAVITVFLINKSIIICIEKNKQKQYIIHLCEHADLIRQHTQCMPVYYNSCISTGKIKATRRNKKTGLVTH